MLFIDYDPSVGNMCAVAGIKAKIEPTSRVGLQCGTVYWRWLYFHVVWCLMIAVVVGSYPMNNIISVIMIISYNTIY